MGGVCVVTDKMLVSAWDYDVIGNNDMLGQVEIPLASLELNMPTGIAALTLSLVLVLVRLLVRLL